jgi:hypothetical protein
VIRPTEPRAQGGHKARQLRDPRRHAHSLGAGEQTTGVDTATSQSRGLTGPRGGARRRSARAVACFIPQKMRVGADGTPQEAQSELKGTMLGQIRPYNQGPFLRGSDWEPGSHPAAPHGASPVIRVPRALFRSHRAADPSTFPGGCRNLTAAALTVARVQLSSIPQTGATKRRYCPASKTLSNPDSTSTSIGPQCWRVSSDRLATGRWQGFAYPRLELVSRHRRQGQQGRKRVRGFQPPPLGHHCGMQGSQGRNKLNAR